MPSARMPSNTAPNLLGFAAPVSALARLARGTCFGSGFASTVGVGSFGVACAATAVFAEAFGLGARRSVGAESCCSIRVVNFILFE